MGVEVIVLFIKVEFLLDHFYDVLKTNHHSLVVVLKIFKTDHFLPGFLRILLHHLVDVLVWELNPLKYLGMLLSCSVEIVNCEVMQVLLEWILFWCPVYFYYLVKVVLRDEFGLLIVNCLHLEEFSVHFEKLDPKISVILKEHFALAKDIHHHE